MARKCFYSIFLISLFIFISCNFLGENLQEHKTDDESVGVKICLNFGNSRQVMPSNYSAAEYKLTGTFNSKETVWTYDTLSKLQSATLYLSYGDWTFTLEAYANDKLIASDTITRTISDTTNTLTFEYKVSKLNYSEDTGSISISVKFPTDKKVSSVIAALYDAENLTTPISNTSNTYTSFSTDTASGNYIVTYTRSAVSSGSYYLIFKFYQTGVEEHIGMWRDLVCVANGCTSSSESTVTEFNEVYSINYHLNGISFKSSYVAPATFNKSQRITLPTADNMDQTNLSFTGWYETTDFSGDRITSWTYDSKTTDVNLYARNTATIIFDMQSYGEQVTSQSVVYGTKASEPIKPTNDTMFFKGWFSDSEKTEKYNFNSVITSNKIVYAKWVDLAEYWAWSYPTSAPTITWEGKGTQAEPYIITNSQELADLAYMANNFTTYSGTYFVLGEDIELNYGKIVTGIDDTLNNWIPIGNATYNFAGNFDGNGKKIKGLYINNDSLENVGLFGIGKAPNNLTIENGYVSANASYAGGIIGKSTTAIENCVNKALLNNSKANSFLGGIAGYGTTFKNCENHGKLTGVSIGGIAGEGNSFENCVNIGKITANGVYCGGIGATLSSGTSLTIKNCSNTADISSQGDYIGGLFSYYNNNSSSIYFNICESSNAGKVCGTNYIGGIISYIKVFNGTYYSKKISILNCTSRGDIEAENGTYIGGICGYLAVTWPRVDNPTPDKPRPDNPTIQNCLFDANISNAPLQQYHFGGICGYVEGKSTGSYLSCPHIINCISSGKLEDGSSFRNIIGGIAGEGLNSFIINCFSKMEILSSDTTSIGGISGKLDTVNAYGHISNSYFVIENGVNCASPRSLYTKTSVGAVTSANGTVFSTDNTTLLYTGTLCEVLNAYRIDNDTDNLYKEWIVGEDGWPTFAE